MAASPPPWLPNAISGVRILLVPAWVWFAEACRNDVVAGGDGATARWLATATLIAIGVSDVLDGWLARRFDLGSQLGATLDAVADKLAQVVLVTWLTMRPILGGSAIAFTALPLAFMLLLIARDAVLATGYLLIRARCGTVEVVHHAHGKIASVLLFALLVLVTADVATVAVLPILLVIAVVVTVSTVSYFRDGWVQWVRGGRS